MAAPAAPAAAPAEAPAAEPRWMHGRWLARPAPGHEVCVTGISGRFPDSESVKEFQENLFSKRDLVTDDGRRWKVSHEEIPRRIGTLPSIRAFDADFFDVHFRLAHAMCPMGRLLLEAAYECIFDAGVNPEELRGSNTAVFVGASTCEAEHSWNYERVDVNPHGSASTHRALLAARVAAWLGLRGSAHVVDTACSSSASALELAFRAVREGRCDAALVGGANLCLHPYISLQFFRLGVLSQDGRCRCYDAGAAGYARAEAVACCFLQRAKDSRRIYAKMVYAKTNCDGYKEQGIFFPAKEIQQVLVDDFYEECGVAPAAVDFVEMHCTGTKVGDICELNVVDDVFCRDRARPLLIGSVKSNMGHSEPAAAMSSLAKICIAYQTGLIAPNINYATPREEAPGLTAGRMTPVTEVTPWSRKLCAMGSFGFGGANAHLLFEGSGISKVNKGLPGDSLPRLVCVSGRTEAAVARILDDLETRPVDVELVKLLHCIHQLDIPLHNSRGYVLLGSTAAASVRLGRGVRRGDYGAPPAARFVYAGAGAAGAAGAAAAPGPVARRLMELAAFRESIERCNHVLKSKGVDLNSLYERGPILDGGSAALAGLCVQLALTDVLESVGVRPDQCVGKGFGELCCSYAEKKATLEEVVLSAYEKSRNINEILEFLTSEEMSEVPENTLIVNFSQFGVKEVKSNKKPKVINLLDASSEDTLHVLLANIGELYCGGLQPRAAALYPPVPLPVSPDTPMLAHLVRWEHSEKWARPYYGGKRPELGPAKAVLFNTLEENADYLLGHVIDGRNLFPATGYLVLAWEGFAEMRGRLKEETSVVLEDVRFLRATSVPRVGGLELSVTIHPASGRFEIMESGASIVTGKITAKKDEGQDYKPILQKAETESELIMNTKDFYKEFRLRGYQYSGLFRGVLDCNVSGTRGHVAWAHNWVTFVDCMLQMCVVGRDTRNLYVPTRLERLSLDVLLHARLARRSEPDPLGCRYAVEADPGAQLVRAGGVEIRGMHATAIPKRVPLGVPVLEKNVFVPNYSDNRQKIEEVLRVNIQIVLENIHTLKVKVIELYDEENVRAGCRPILQAVGDAVNDLPLTQPELVVYAPGDVQQSEDNVTVEKKGFSKGIKAVLAIGANLLQRADVLNQAFEAIRENGFIISRENSKPEENPNVDFVTIADVGTECIVMLQKPVPHQKTEFVKIVTMDDQFPWIEEVKEKLRSKSCKRLVLWSQSEECSGLLGLVNCLRREPGGDRVKGLLVADPAAPPFDPEMDFYKEQLKKNLALNVYQDGQWGTYRHLLLGDTDTVAAPHAYVNTLTTGDLSSLSWLQGPLRENQKFSDPDEVLVQVYVSALNFRDVMTASGRVTLDAVASGRAAEDCVQGLELAGRAPNGSRVIALVPSGGLANAARCRRGCVWPVPPEWTLEEAATVPVVYATALYALFMVGKMKRGESVLIHAGSGGVGQAAINVALHHGCEVFTTVGTAEKRAFIKKLFPQLKDSNIGNSRDTSFEDMIRRETKGKGVDLALNSLADEKLLATVRCLGYRGRFLEIGKFDVSRDTGVDPGGHSAGLELSFHGISVDCLLFMSPELGKRLSRLLMQQLAAGAVRPLARSRFTTTEVEPAFRYMAAGRHAGKVVVTLRDEEPQEVLPPTSLPLPAVPRYMCTEEHAYVVVGGLGGFGLELADWLIMRGARKLVLTSRRGVSNGYQSSRLRAWRSYGADVQISTHDVTTLEGCEEMLRTAQQLGPVRAVFNLAAVLKDAIFENQTAETFRISFAPKALITLHLDALTEKMCPNLKDFVVFSSVSCGRGNAGQTNYGMSNSVMERVCERRRRAGLPALAVQWGAVGDVGLVADMQDEDVQLEIGGTLQQRVGSCLSALDRLLRAPHAVLASMVVAEKVAGAGGGSLVDAVARVIGLKDMKTVSHQVSLADFGMDSLTAVEVKQMLEREFEIILTPQELRNLTFGRLVELSKLREASQEPAGAPAGGGRAARGAARGAGLVEGLMDEEAAAVPYVFLPTAVSKGQHDGPPTLGTAFLVSGLGGAAAGWRALALALRARACVLRPALRRHRSLRHLLASLYETLKPLLPPAPARVTLAGHSCGAQLALGLAALLEGEGRRGAVVCLDGSPAFCRAMLRARLDTASPRAMQDGLLCDILQSVIHNMEMTKSLQAKLSDLETFDEKLECMATFIKEQQIAFKFPTKIAYLCWDMVNACFNFDEESFAPIASRVVLVRATAAAAAPARPADAAAAAACAGLPADYGLSRCTTGAVTVHDVDADHASILYKTETSEIINNVLC